MLRHDKLAQLSQDKVEKAQLVESSKKKLVVKVAQKLKVECAKDKDWRIQDLISDVDRPVEEVRASAVLEMRVAAPPLQLELEK